MTIEEFEKIVDEYVDENDEDDNRHQQMEGIADWMSDMNDFILDIYQDIYGDASRKVEESEDYVYEIKHNMKKGSKWYTKDDLDEAQEELDDDKSELDEFRELPSDMIEFSYEDWEWFSEHESKIYPLRAPRDITPFPSKYGLSLEDLEEYYQVRGTYEADEFMQLSISDRYKVLKKYGINY